MNFLVDAQLPRRLVQVLTEAGFDTLHTLDLPDGNRTSDASIIEMADRDDRIVVSKDADFVNSHLILGRPRRLLLVSTGNIKNADLEVIFRARLPEIVSAFVSSNFVELSRTDLFIHG
jgi:predicted nuclease of predicted toxin-antitoxin system